MKAVRDTMAEVLWQGDQQPSFVPLADLEEEDRAQLNRAIQQAEIEKQGVQQPELFSRYQRSISRDLHEALDRLEAMRERKIKGSMGSFGTGAKEAG